MMSINQKQLESFTAYCKAYPELRFWQALRNWSKYDFIIGRRVGLDDEMREVEDDQDTFYLEN